MQKLNRRKRRHESLEGDPHELIIETVAAPGWATRVSHTRMSLLFLVTLLAAVGFRSGAVWAFLGLVTALFALMLAARQYKIWHAHPDLQVRRGYIELSGVNLNYHQVKQMTLKRFGFPTSRTIFPYYWLSLSWTPTSQAEIGPNFENYRAVIGAILRFLPPGDAEFEKMRRKWKT